MAKITTRLSDSLSSINLADPAPAGSACVEFMWNIIQTLLSAGWTHFASGTGTGGTFSTTPGNVNNQITGTGTGAGGFDRNNAWIVLRCPANKRQLLIQRGTGQTQWRVYYSALDTFVGTGFGAISATVPPSAADQGQVCGTANGFLAVGTPSTSQGTRFHCVAYSDPANTDCYTFYAWATGPTNSAIYMLVCFETLRQFNALDADPIMQCWFPNNGNQVGSTSLFADLLWFGWYKMNLASESFDSWLLVQQNTNASSTLIPATNQNSLTGVGPDPNDAAEPSIELAWVRPSSSYAARNGTKGTSLRIRGSGVSFRAWPARHDPTSVAEARVFADCLLLPWIANTVPSLG